MKKLLLILLVLLGLQTQAQISPCDSVGYSYLSGTGGNPTIQLSGVVSGICPVNFPCTVVSWNWYITNSGFSPCFSATGQTATCHQLNITDTIEVCLNTILNVNNSSWTCMKCDFLVYGVNGWMKMGVLTSIKEVKVNTIKNNKTYDLLGREVFEIPKGSIYIKNRKKYIK